IGGRADHRFTTTVERRVERHTITGQLFQLDHQVVPARVMSALHYLGAGGAVVVDDFPDAPGPAFVDLEGEGHEGAGMINLEHVWGDGIEHGWAERTPAFAKLDLCVDAIGNAGHARTADDRTPAQRARAELHTPLKPGHRMALDHKLGNVFGYVVDRLPLRLIRVACARGNVVLVVVTCLEVDVYHLLLLHALMV